MEKPKKMDRQIVFKLLNEEFEEIEEKRGNLSRSFYIRNKVFNPGLDKEQKETFKLIFDTMWEKLSYTIKKKILKDFSKQVSIIQGVLS